MEDLKNRLKFEDISVRTRCVQKLVQVIKKKIKGELVTATSKQIPELNLLWETCLSELPTTTNYAVQAIVYLVTNRHLDITYTINKFLGSISNSSNVHAVVKGISKVLIYQQEINNGKQSYSVHYPQHPLITVLKSNEDYLPLILESIADAVSEENTSRGFQAMEPIITYLLYNPGQRSNYSKVLLLETLIDTITEESNTAFYVLRCIPYLQIDTYEQFSEASFFILKAEQAFNNLKCSDADHFYISELFLLASLSLSERGILLGFEPTRMLNLALSISSSLIRLQSNFPFSYCDICLVLIALTLKSATGVYIQMLTSIAMVLLDVRPISPTISSFLAISVIHLLPEPCDMSFTDKMKFNLSRLLNKLEQHFVSNQDSENLNQAQKEVEANLNIGGSTNMIFIEAFSFSTESALQCVHFAKKLDESNSTMKLNWLNYLQNNVNTCSSLEKLDVIFSIVAALFLGSPDNVEFLRACLDTFDAILSKNCDLSTRIFPLLLYKQNVLKLPDCKFLILEFLPKSATHKYAISPVISTLKMMSTDPELKAFSLHLMLTLWKKHDRCFPYLHQQILENEKSISKDTKVNETLISQAASIKEICLIAPEKHGSDFLGILSKIINESNDEASLPAVCLALEGVINLCKAEIIDLRSTWKSLGPKLSRDKRTPITCRMYELLSLLPELQVNSPEFDAFLNETVMKIWKQISSGNLYPEVESAAYKALSKFPFDSYKLKQLPSAAKANLALPPSMKSTPFEMAKSPEDVLTYIPGYAFLDLLKSMDNEIALEGYADFLNSIIKQEVAALPRSAYSQRKHLQKRQNTNESLLKIPKFLCSQFEAKKSPSLQKNLAVGVLLCYEPPLEYGKDGEPIKRSIAYQSRFYEQVLGTLLNEVNIDATEWQRSILLPGAWGSFMERAFFAYEEARKAELELQRNLGHLIVSPEEFNFQCKTAWLWVRDRITNLIRTCVKNAPTSHANAIFAITGLVHALNKFYASLDDSSKTLAEESENFTKHEVFVTECTETILCALKPNHEPSGKVHSWLLTHLSRPNSSSNYLIKGCSCASLYHLISTLMATYGNEIPGLIKDLLENLTHSSPVLNIYSGIGLGFFIKSLCDTGYPEIGEAQCQLLIDTAKQIFSLYVNEETSSSSILVSLTLTMVALSHVPNEEYRDWISTSCNIFREKLMEEEVSSMNFEVLSICVSAMLIAAAEGSSITVDGIETITSWFEEKQSELPQCSGTSVALGLLIEALERFGCSQSQTLKQKLQKDWFNTLSSEKRPTLHRIAALNGLSSLYSCGRGLLQAKSKTNSANNMISDLVSIIFQLLNATRDTGLQNICSWEVGRLYAVHSFNQEAEESVPSSYHYLNEKSTLKFVIKMIIDGHDNDIADVKPCHQLTCLKALDKEFSRSLPPLNWPSILTPFLENKQDVESINCVLNILIHQSKGSPQALNLLGSYSCPPLFHSLPEKSKEILLKNIPELVPILPISKLQGFFQIIISFIMKQDNELQDLKNLTMQGVLETLKLTNLKQQSLKLVQDAFITIFKSFKKDYCLINKHIAWISSGLSSLPEKRMDSILSIAKNTNDIATLTTIWCFFVKTGEMKLSSLRPCIEEGKHACLSDKQYICAALYDCFVTGIHNNKSEISLPEKCISWLLETIGWVNVLIQSKSKFQLMTVDEIFVFLNDVCMATIIGCSGLECSYNLLPVLNLTHQQLLENISIAITKLCTKQDWVKVMDKIIEWLMSLLKSEYFHQSDKHFIKLCLCSMRNLSEFQKSDIWSNVINNIY